MDTHPLPMSTWILAMNSQMMGTAVAHISLAWLSNEHLVAFEEVRAEADRPADCWMDNAWMLERRPGILQNTRFQPSPTLEWLVFKPSWQESLSLLPRTSPRPCVPGLVWDEEGTTSPSGPEEPGLPACTACCPWVWAVAGGHYLPSKARLFGGHSNGRVCKCQMSVVPLRKRLIWNVFSCFRGN